MSSRTLHRFTLLLLAACIGTTGTTRVCNGTDGHLSFEPAFAPCCSPGLQDVGMVIRTVTEGRPERGCGPCVDVRFGEALEGRSGNWRVKVPEPEPTSPAGAPHLSALAALLARTSSTASLPRSGPAVAEFLTGTVLLRC